MERAYSNASIFADYISRFQLTQCHICSQKYNKTDKKPMTMCLEAMHVICLSCFNCLRNRQDMDRCTLCRDAEHTNLFNHNHINRIMMSVLDYEQFLKEKHTRDMQNKEDQIKKLKGQKKALEKQVLKFKQQNKQLSKLKVQLDNLRFQYNRKYQEKIEKALFKIKRQNGLIVGHLAQELQKYVRPFVLQKIRQYQEEIIEHKLQMNQLMHTILKQEQKISNMIQQQQNINEIEQERSLIQSQITRTQDKMFGDLTKKQYKKRLQKKMSSQYNQLQQKFIDLEQILSGQSDLERYRKNSSTSTNCATIDSQSQFQA